MTRQCGGCTLCCKLLPMMRDHPTYSRERIGETMGEMIARGMATPDDFAGMIPEFDKQPGKPCPHQRHAKGCAIYASRPFSCRFWNCRWLVNADTADLRRPDRSRYVIDIMPDFITARHDDNGERIKIQVVQIWCDPANRDAWRDPALLDYLERRGREGIAALIRFGPGDAITVFPPAMCSDGEFRIVSGTKMVNEHRGDELIEGLAQTQKVVFQI